MSYTINLIRRFGEAYYESFIFRSLDKIQELIFRAYRISFLSRMFEWLSKMILESLIWQSFLKEDKDISIFEESMLTRITVEIINKNFKKVEKGYIKSFFIGSIHEGLLIKLYNKPLFTIGIILLSATVTNTIIWSIFDKFEIIGLTIRLVIIMILLLYLFR